MVKIPFEFRLSEVGAELSSLGEYRETVEQQIAFVADQRKVQMNADLRRAGLEHDEGEVSLALQEYRWEVEHALPKALRGSYIVLLWAVYESGVSDVARFIQKNMGVRLSPTDIRGSDVLNRFQKYFEHILKFPLHPNISNWEELERIYGVRNAFAHANGRLGAMNARIRDSMNKLLEIGVIDESYGDIIPTESFTENCYNTINTHLRDLVSRARQWDDERRKAPPT